MDFTILKRLKFNTILLFGCLTILTGCGGDTSTPALIPVAPAPPVSSDPPVVTVDGAFSVKSGEEVTITGVVTDDNGVASLLWDIYEGPLAPLKNAETDTVSFIAPEVSTTREIRIRLIALDGEGQKNGDGASVFVNPIIENATQVDVSIEQTPIREMDDRDFFISSDGDTIVYDGESSLSLEVPEDLDNYVTMLVDNQGDPRMVSFADPINGQVELSSATSVEAFVLRSPRFYGTQITDKAELSRRIRAHPKFAESETEMRDTLRTSVCPMDSMCNGWLSRLAEEIAQDLDLEDLRIVGE